MSDFWKGLQLGNSLLYLKFQCGAYLNFIFPKTCSSILRPISPLDISDNSQHYKIVKKENNRAKQQFDRRFLSMQFSFD